MASIDPKDIDRLKVLVQAIEPATKLENLVAGLIGDLIGTSVAVAKSGFQHGADAGTAGRQGRFLRVECKRYRDTTSLDDRQLLGEMDHAFAHDPALELWILAASREVPEQLEKDLTAKGEGQGVPVLILDWKSHETASLAVLLASQPALVETFINKEAGEIAARLQPAVGPRIEQLRREFAGWQIGTTMLRRRSWERLGEVWLNPRQSRAHFGQVVSGGALPLIHRTPLLQKLDAWWAAPPKPASPVCVNGMMGVGKTWVVVDWLMQRKDALPSVLLVPASALPGPGNALGSVYGVKRFLAERLFDLAQVRDVDHWRARLERMLQRPEAEGCALVVVFDGMSQQPTVEWNTLMNVLQADEFRGRIRVVATTRSHHFDNQLRRLRGLEERAVPVEVDVYDAQPGGEFDQMLALHGLIRNDLHPELHALARNPRLFDLVIRFRERLVDGGTVTLHRLLWEYGRDTAGESLNREFSAAEWEEWLQAAAKRLRDGIQTYTTQELSDLTARPYLDRDAIYQRLSEIIDTPFVRARADRTLELSPEFVAHALGATAVSFLASAEHADRGQLEAMLVEWLDPIAGLDQRAEILRAAVAIALESGPPRPLLGVLVAAWLQTQNLGETHVRDAHLLAAEIPEALLDTIELSNRHTHAWSQHHAVSALRGVDRGNARVRKQVLARAADWLRVISRDLDPRAKPEPEAERHRHERLMSRVGVDASGEQMILGESMQLVDRDDTLWAEHVPALLEGYPLIDAVPLLQIAAVAASVAFNHSAWNQLRWACLLNPIDPEALATAVRTAAAEMQTRVPEPGRNPSLPARAAQLLLHIPGHRHDDEAAAALKVQLGKTYDYDTHYLANPVHSLFALERRHAMDALNDTSLSLRNRVQRCGDMWLDPTFEAPVAVRQEVVEAVNEIDVNQLYTGRNVTREDNDFDALQAVLARCAPRELAALRRRLVRTPVTEKDRAARAWQINRALVLYGPTEAAGARQARLQGREIREGDEILAASELLLPELVGKDALAQAVTVVEADMAHIPISITDAIEPLTVEQADQLIRQFQGGTSKQQRDVLVLLITSPPVLSDFAWSWVTAYTASEDEIDRRLAYMALVASDPMRLGLELNQQGWRFTAGADTFLAHAASGALFTATTALPFEQVAARLAPWRLLEAVRHRGGDPSEIRLAAELLDAILVSGPAQALDVGARLTVRRDTNSTSPTRYSVNPHPPADSDSAEALRQAFDTEAQMAAIDRAGEVADARIRKARQEGASLFLEFVAQADGLALCRYVPEVVERWVAGHEELSPDFVRRVVQAEGLFLAICEALLVTAPAQGVSLWQALRRSFRTRIEGPAKLPELLHLLFRASDSPQVMQARDDLLSLTSTNTDADLYEVALVAALNGRSDWLEARIASDAASYLPWRQQRAATLAGFRVGNTLPVAGAWPESPSTSWAEDVARRSSRLQFLEACARHWWKEYWRREDLDQAYAAWVLFCQCADRRAVAWMASEAERSTNSDALKTAKLRHWRANRLGWKHGADKSSLSLQRNFLWRTTDDKVWPWRAS
ncbi:hypothetical protein [Lysobacter silvisoli]|uniref:NACHT domain-containing protein n=1 Tax=Lysobacter silvisoli TaxID=2293254 RepID=A0A371K2A4_9GAMM|nr:hypothetical protein [Lysobacter silvisoli]RDZ28000.1 hypothetical protein DX914_02290 [Lysobacter silvisoli]